MSNARCFWCGKKDAPLNRDHVLPRAEGGTDRAENIVTSCYACNHCRSDAWMIVRRKKRWAYSKNRTMARRLERYLQIIADVDPWLFRAGKKRGKKRILAFIMAVKKMCAKEGVSYHG